MKKPGMPIETDLDRFAADCLPEFADAIRRGSLSFLSVANGSLLAAIAAQPGQVFAGFGTAAADYYKKYPELRDIKNAFFEYTLHRVVNGETVLLPHLAKGITSRKQVDRYLQLLDGASDTLRQAPPAITKLLVYPGTFDPMHYGHRLMIASLLDKVGAGASLAINVNSYQARKNNLAETYERRLADMEYKLLKSDILDPYRVCVMDFRFGAQEGEDHLRQTRMQAFMARDRRLHWVIGGDKFLSEVERGQAEEAAGTTGRTLSRFNLDTMSIYVVPRKGQDMALFRQQVAQHNARYAAEFVLAEEKAYDGAPISATLIRTYRDHSDAELRREAERMEKVDLKRNYHHA
ncbi:MAG TPA: hypothetical protein VGO07_07645 [Candidatus Saccharimonadales bacterium]|jgi:hypothetical protein|nr:hypothetical protein [Candidatus Saccharimonadales bacterium]